MRFTLAAVAVVGCALAVAPAALAQETGTVRVLHGLPGTVVDVYIDDQRVLDDFRPYASTDPIDVPAGGRQFEIFAADAPDGSGQPLVSTVAEVTAGGSTTVAAHLSGSGTPTVTPFVDDVSEVPVGQSRLVVRNTAATGAVDVLLGGAPVASGLTNPDQQAVRVPAGTVSAAVAAAGTTGPLVGPVDLALSDGGTTFVHAVGSPQDGTLDLLVLTVDAPFPGTLPISDLPITP